MRFWCLSAKRCQTMLQFLKDWLYSLSHCARWNIYYPFVVFALVLHKHNDYSQALYHQSLVWSHLETNIKNLMRLLPIAFANPVGFPCKLFFSRQNRVDRIGSDIFPMNGLDAMLLQLGRAQKTEGGHYVSYLEGAVQIFVENSQLQRQMDIDRRQPTDASFFRNPKIWSAPHTATADNRMNRGPLLLL